MIRYSHVAALTVALLASSTALAAPNLLVNGNFESSTSQTTTPTGWTNVGHMDGVVAYSLFGTPAYDGNYLYDLGGFGNAFGPPGDGIQQSVATSVGGNYTLQFGVSSENVAGAGSTTLRVTIGGVSTDFILVSNSAGEFRSPFLTQTLSYVATSSNTLISFIEFANNGGGNNDPLIDGVIFSGSGTTTSVPEPEGLALFGLGVVAFAMARRRRRVD